MRSAKLKSMSRGWFVGNFDPSMYKTNDVEVAVKHYEPDDYEPSHLHKIATEVTVIIQGRAQMNGVTYAAGDIVVVEPGESTDFRALERTVNVVVKIPGANNDKYVV